MGGGLAFIAEGCRGVLGPAIAYRGFAAYDGRRGVIRPLGAFRSGAFASARLICSQNLRENMFSLRLCPPKQLKAISSSSGSSVVDGSWY